MVRSIMASVLGQPLGERTLECVFYRRTSHRRCNGGRSWLNVRKDQKYKPEPNCEDETQLNAVRRAKICARKSEADGCECQAQTRLSEESRAKRSGSSSRNGRCSGDRATGSGQNRGDASGELKLRARLGN